MLVKILTNIGTRDCEVSPLLMRGQSRDVDNRVGQELVRRGLAINITPALKPPMIVTTPVQPAIAEATAPEIQPARQRAYKSAVLKVQPPIEKDK